MYVSEAAPVGTVLGKIKADDRDIGDNAATDYVLQGQAPHIIDIINNKSQEGTVILNMVRCQMLLSNSTEIIKTDEIKYICLL